MKLLVCIMEYYPLHSASANCISNILEVLQKRYVGLTVDILTFKDRPDNLDEEYYSESMIHRIYDIRRVHRKEYFEYLNGKHFAFAKKILFCGLKGFYRVQKYLAKSPCRVMARTIEKNIDKLNRKNKYDVIICCSGDFPISFAGAKYRNKNHSFKLITYWLDPLVGNILFDHYNEKIVKDDQDFIFSKSDKIVVTPVIYDSLSDVSKITSIEFPSFFENRMYTSNVDNIVYDRDCINLIYTGTFYDDIRNPSYLMELINKSDENIVLHICGHMDTFFVNRYKYLIEKKKIILHGNVSQEIMYNAIIDSDYLVNVGNSTSMLLPSKLISYISTGKPIINLYQIEDCPTLRYLEKYNNNINLYQKESLEENLLKLHAFLKEPQFIIPYDVIVERYQECTTSYIAEKGFGDIMNLV